MKLMPLEELQKQINQTTALCKLMGATYPEEYPEYVQARLQLFSLRIASGVGSRDSPQRKDVEGACRNGLGLVNSMERLYGNTPDLLGFVIDGFAIKPSNSILVTLCEETGRKEERDTYAQRRDAL